MSNLTPSTARKQQTCLQAQPCYAPNLLTLAEYCELYSRRLALVAELARLDHAIAELTPDQHQESTTRAIFISSLAGMYGVQP